MLEERCHSQKVVHVICLVSELSAFHSILNVLEVAPWEFHAAFFLYPFIIPMFGCRSTILDQCDISSLFKMAALLESPTFVYNDSHFALVLCIALHSFVFFLQIDVSMAIKILRNIDSNCCNISDKVP